MPNDLELERNKLEDVLNKVTKTFEIEKKDGSIIDYKEYDPATDKSLYVNYSAEDFQTIISTLTFHKKYNITYYRDLCRYVRTLTDDEIKDISTYFLKNYIVHTNWTKGLTYFKAKEAIKQRNKQKFLKEIEKAVDENKKLGYALSNIQSNVSNVDDIDTAAMSKLQGIRRDMLLDLEYIKLFRRRYSF